MSLPFTYTMRGKGSTFFTFKVNGIIQFSNACLLATVSTLSLPSSPLAGQVTFTPDLTTVQDSVSKLYDIAGLCGGFTLNTVTCKDLSTPNVLSGQNIVLAPNWDKKFIGSINCVVDYKSTRANTYYPTQNVIWSS